MVQKFHSEVIKLGKFEVAEVAEGESPGDLNEETALSNTGN